VVVKKDQKEVNWASYFAKIRGVCPWSFKAHMQDKILFIPYTDTTLSTWAVLFSASKHEAFVYKCPEKSVDWLNSMCDKLNAKYTEYEWLWSHPAEGGDSTPVPVLIQQDRAQLEKLREAIGYEEE